MLDLIKYTKIDQPQRHREGETGGAAQLEIYAELIELTELELSAVVGVSHVPTPPSGSPGGDLSDPPSWP